MTFLSFRFTLKNHEDMFKNLFKNLPKSIQNWTRTPSKTTLKKTTGKSTTGSTKSQNLLPTWVPGGGGRQVRFRVFFVSGRPLEPKLSQDLPQEPPGPPRALIFHDFRSIYDVLFGSCCDFLLFLLFLYFGHILK